MSCQQTGFEHGLFIRANIGFNPAAMRQKHSTAKLKFRAFSDQTRLRILHLLMGGEICVCDIVAILKIPQPTASRHLAYLRRAALVATRRKGPWMYYSLAPAKTKFERKLFDCLANCFEEIVPVRADRAALAKLRTKKRCC